MKKLIVLILCQFALLPIQSQSIISLPTGEVVAVFDTSILRPIYRTALERDALKLKLDSCKEDGQYLIELLSLKEQQINATKQQVDILKNENSYLRKTNDKTKILLKFAKYSILLNGILIAGILIF